MKKLLVLFALIALVLGSFTGCAKTPEVTGPKTVKVGIAIYKFDDTFMTNYRTEMETYLKGMETADVKYEVSITDGKNDQATQTEQIDSFIAQAYDVLIVNLVDLTAASTIIDKVKAAAIPTVFIITPSSAIDLVIFSAALS